jgi:hypothetical protein
MIKQQCLVTLRACPSIALDAWGWRMGTFLPMNPALYHPEYLALDHFYSGARLLAHRAQHDSPQARPGRLTSEASEGPAGPT